MHKDVKQFRCTICGRTDLNAERDEYPAPRRVGLAGHERERHEWLVDDTFNLCPLCAARARHDLSHALDNIGSDFGPNGRAKISAANLLGMLGGEWIDRPWRLDAPADSAIPGIVPAELQGEERQAEEETEEVGA